MGRLWSEIVKISEWNQPNTKRCFSHGFDDGNYLEKSLRLAYPSCFSEKHEDEGPVPWSVIKLLNADELGEPSNDYISEDALHGYLEPQSFALSLQSASDRAFPALSDAESYAFLSRFEYKGKMWVVLGDETVYRDDTIYAVREDAINWEA